MAYRNKPEALDQEGVGSGVPQHRFQFRDEHGIGARISLSLSLAPEMTEAELRVRQIEILDLMKHVYSSKGGGCY
jgi:hypothetical protein